MITPPPATPKTIVYARLKLALGGFFALFGVVIIVQALLRIRDHGPNVLPLLAMGGLMIALGYVRYRQYNAVMRQL